MRGSVLGKIVSACFAVAGIAVSGVSIVLIVFFVVALLPALSRARDMVRLVKCEQTLSAIGKVVMLRHDMRDNIYPPSLKALLDEGLVTDPRVFLCPGTDTKADGDEFVTDYESIFDLITQANEANGVQDAPPITEEMLGDYDTPIVWDKAPNHLGGRNVLYMDCHVEHMSEEEFNSRVADRVRQVVAEAQASENSRGGL